LPPWLLVGLSLPLIESHYENNYGGAVRKLNAIAEQLERSIPESAAGPLQRAQARGAGGPQLIAAARALLRLPGRRRQATGELSAALARDFGSFDRWRRSSSPWAMPWAAAPAGSCSPTSRATSAREPVRRRPHAGDPGGVPIIALDMYEHAYHMDFGANAKAYVGTFMRNLDWKAAGERYADALQAAAPRPLEQPEFAGIPSVPVEEVKAMIDSGQNVQIIDARPAFSASRQGDIVQGRDVAGPGPGAGMDEGAVEIRSGRRLLRLRLPRGLPHGGRAARGGVRRALHAGRPLGLKAIGAKTQLLA
jgi:Fe-Mn family superoxide dismutase